MSDSVKKCDTKRNLCRTCQNEFAECRTNLKFGDGFGNDNVYECDGYKPTKGKVPRW